MTAERAFATAAYKLPAQILTRRQLRPGKHLYAILASGRPQRWAPAHARRLIWVRQPLRLIRLSEDACALMLTGGVRFGEAAPTDKLTDGAFEGDELHHYTAYNLLVWTWYFESGSLTYAGVPDYFPNLASDNLVRKLTVCSIKARTVSYPTFIFAAYLGTNRR